jgi:hypothetical protein
MRRMLEAAVTCAAASLSTACGRSDLGPPSAHDWGSEDATGNDRGDVPDAEIEDATGALDSSLDAVSSDAGGDATDAAPTCAEAATAVCNASAACGPNAMDLLSCAGEAGEIVYWVSVDACIMQLTADCGPDAAPKPLSPTISSPAACIGALPFVCHDRAAVIPANCVACIPITFADAGL